MRVKDLECIVQLLRKDGQSFSVGEKSISYDKHRPLKTDKKRNDKD